MIHPFKGTKPEIDASALVVDSAQIIGDVKIGEESSVWFNAVIRGDVNYIRIGKRTNIQDGCVLHVARKTLPLEIGDEVTVGHNVTLHACTIGSQCLIRRTVDRRSRFFSYTQYKNSTQKSSPWFSCKSKAGIERGRDTWNSRVCCQLRR